MEYAPTYIVIITTLLAVSTLVMMFIPKLPACITAYVTMWVARLGGLIMLSDNTMIFWGVAVAIAVINHFLLPRQVRYSSRGLPYIAAGAIVGAALGLTMYRAATIIGGAVVGAVLAAIAYARTERGKSLDFPTVRFFNYLGAKGIPAVMAASMLGLSLASFLILNNA